MREAHFDPERRANYHEDDRGERVYHGVPAGYEFDGEGVLRPAPPAVPAEPDTPEPPPRPARARSRPAPEPAPEPAPAEPEQADTADEAAEAAGD